MSTGVCIIDTCILAQIHITPIWQTHTNTEALYIFMVDALPLMGLHGFDCPPPIIDREDLFYVVFSLLDVCIVHLEIVS